MATIKFKVNITPNQKKPTFVFASKADTPGATGDFIAPTGWTAHQDGDAVYLEKDVPDTAGYKTYTFTGIGWNGQKISMPKQVVTRLSDEELFLNQSGIHTMSVNDGVLTFKFKDDFVGLTSNDNIKLAKNMGYSLAGNTVNFQCDLLKTVNGKLKIVANVSPGEYPYTFDGGSGVFEVVPFKKQLTTNVHVDDLKKKRMMSSKHIIDRTAYNKNDYVIYNKRSFSIEVDGNFSFHGVGDFANYYNANIIFSENILELPNIDTSFVFGGCVKLKSGLLKFNIKNAKTLIGYVSGTKSLETQIKFTPHQTIQASDLSYMFEYSAYNHWPIFKTDNLLKLESTFEGNEAFNNRVLHWEISKVNNFKNLFKNTLSYDQPLWKWNAKIGSSPSVGEINMQGMFENSIFNHGINNWNVSKVSNFKNMFKNNTHFDKHLWNWGNKIGGWIGVSSVNLEGMFEKTIFNKPINKWNVSKVSTLKNTFADSEYTGGLKWFMNLDTDMLSDMTGFLKNTKINKWALKKYDCRYKDTPGIELMYGDDLPQDAVAGGNISNFHRFTKNLINDDPCLEEDGPRGIPSDDTEYPDEIYVLKTKTSTFDNDVEGEYTLSFYNVNINGIESRYYSNESEYQLVLEVNEDANQHIFRNNISETMDSSSDVDSIFTKDGATWSSILVCMDKESCESIEQFDEQIYVSKKSDSSISEDSVGVYTLSDEKYLDGNQEYYFYENTLGYKLILKVDGQTHTHILRDQNYQLDLSNSSESIYTSDGAEWSSIIVCAGTSECESSNNQNEGDGENEIWVERTDDSSLSIDVEGVYTLSSETYSDMMTNHTFYEKSNGYKLILNLWGSPTSHTIRGIMGETIDSSNSTESVFTADGASWSNVKVCEDKLSCGNLVDPVPTPTHTITPTLPDGYIDGTGVIQLTYANFDPYGPPEELPSLAFRSKTIGFDGLKVTAEVYKNGNFVRDPGLGSDLSPFIQTFGTEDVTFNAKLVSAFYNDWDQSHKLIIKIEGDISDLNFDDILDDDGNNFSMNATEIKITGCSNFDLRHDDYPNSTLFKTRSVLEKVDLSEYTGKITNADELFSYCDKLKEIDLTNVDFSNCETFRYMFQQLGSFASGQIKEFNIFGLNDIDTSGTLEPVFGQYWESYDESHPMIGMFDSCNWKFKEKFILHDWSVENMKQPNSFGFDDAGGREPNWMQFPIASGQIVRGVSAAQPTIINSPILKIQDAKPDYYNHYFPSGGDNGFNTVWGNQNYQNFPVDNDWIAGRSWYYHTSHSTSWSWRRPGGDTGWARYLSARPVNYMTHLNADYREAKLLPDHPYFELYKENITDKFYGEQSKPIGKTFTFHVQLAGDGRTPPSGVYYTDSEDATTRPTVRTWYSPHYTPACSADRGSECSPGNYPSPQWTTWTTIKDEGFKVDDAFDERQINIRFKFIDDSIDIDNLNITIIKFDKLIHNINVKNRWLLSDDKTSLTFFAADTFKLRSKPNAQGYFYDVTKGFSSLWNTLKSISLVDANYTLASDYDSDDYIPPYREDLIESNGYIELNYNNPSEVYIGIEAGPAGLTIDWDDGTYDTYYESDDILYASKQYESPDENRTIRIFGDVTRFGFDETMLREETGSHTTRASILYANEKISSAKIQGMSTIRAFDNAFNNAKNATSIDIVDFDTLNVYSMHGVFWGCREITSLDVGNWTTNDVIDMSFLFNGCNNLNSINGLDKLTTSKVKSFSSMFGVCRELTQINVSNFDVSSAEDMSSMFISCAKVEYLDVAQWQTQKNKNLYHMFAFCESLKSISLENWNTDNLETIMAMFMNCKTLTSLNLSNFNTTKITTFAYLFWNCENLSSLNVNGWDISSETTNYSFNNMFYRNGKLMNVDFTSWCVEHINDDPTNFKPLQPSSIADGPDTAFPEEPNWGEPC